MGDVQPCEAIDPERYGACPPDGRYQLNTQVAILSNGSMVRKYHKSHLFHEPQFNEAILSDPEFFDLPRSGGASSARLGMGVCFDIMYREPAVELARAAKVDALLLSSWWVNTPPTATATQLYSAIARRVQLPLAVSGGVMDPVGTFSGMGVWDAEGASSGEYTQLSGSPGDAVLVLDLPLAGSLSLPQPPPVLLESAGGAHHSSAADQPLHCNDTAAQQHSRRRLGSVHHAWRAARAGSWGFHTARVAPGGTATLAASSGALTCVATLEAASGAALASNTSTESPSVVYGVLAFEGRFDEYYEEQFCALAVCANETHCDQPLWEPAGGRTLNLTAWSIAGNITLQDGYDPLYLAAADGGRTLAGGWLRGEMSGEYLVLSSLVDSPAAAVPEAKGEIQEEGGSLHQEGDGVQVQETALLNAAILARRVWT